MTDIWPLTIVKDRYDGTYSGGKWTAWNMNHWEIPKELTDDEVGCASLCAIYNNVYGRGNTPQEAIDDLKCIIEYGKHIPIKRNKYLNQKIDMMLNANKKKEEVWDEKKYVKTARITDIVEENM